MYSNYSVDQSGSLSMSDTFNLPLPLTTVYELISSCSLRMESEPCKNNAQQVIITEIHIKTC